MENQSSLLSYLQVGLPGLPMNQPQRPPRNTTNTAYSTDDIQRLDHWKEFNVGFIHQQYRDILENASLPEDRFPDSPPREIATEIGFRAQLAEDLFPRMRRALRCGFSYMADTNQGQGLTKPISFDGGSAARTIATDTPDIAYYDRSIPMGTGPNWAPGAIKSSWKWNSAMATSADAATRSEYRQGLSQVNWYSRQHDSRYGFLLTDRELVVLRRLDDNGNLELAPPIPFRIAGTAEQPQLTVTLALWYIGMLAAEHQPPHAALIDPCGSLTSPREYSNSSAQTPLPLKMSGGFDNIEPTEISFLKKLHAQRFSEIFLVNIRSETCVMKVHHGRGPPKYYEPQDRELDIHILESTAYRRLKERDLCDRGVISHFFGTMRKFDPSSCQPHLRHFVEDEYPPSAIFMEYIPGLEMITLENYTEKRVANLLDAIRQIHKAFVRHKDVKPRNMMVVKDTPDRVIWLDFDRAETYDEDQITDEQVEGLKEEEQIMMEFSSFMATDYANGQLEKAYLMYCT